MKETREEKIKFLLDNILSTDVNINNWKLKIMNFFNSNVYYDKGEFSSDFIFLFLDPALIEKYDLIFDLLKEKRYYYDNNLNSYRALNVIYDFLIWFKNNLDE